MDLIKPLRLSSCVASGIAVRCATWGGTHEACSDIDVDVLKWNSVFLSLSLSCGAAWEGGEPLPHDKWKALSNIDVDKMCVCGLKPICRHLC